MPCVFMGCIVMEFKWHFFCFGHLNVCTSLLIINENEREIK